MSLVRIEFRLTAELNVLVFGRRPVPFSHNQNMICTKGINRFLKLRAASERLTRGFITIDLIAPFGTKGGDLAI